MQAPYEDSMKKKSTLGESTKKRKENARNVARRAS
jgi:hypothetical protein